MTFNILVTDNLHKAGLAMLEAVDGFNIIAPGKMSRGDALAAIPEAHALIIRSGTQADRAMIEAAPKLKVICRAGVGVDNVDIAAATAHGVVVMNAPDGNSVATAELAMGLMLALARHIPQAAASLGAGEWKRKTFSGTELRGKTLGIVGLGRIGRHVARRAAAFDMHLIAYDPFIGADDMAALGVEKVELEALWAQSDYITLHTPIIESTRHMVNAKTIAMMKDGVRIVNGARGGLIDEDALAEAIKSGKVAGAAIDVYPKEPPPEDFPLLHLPQVVHTPHLGASTAEAQADVAKQAAQQVIDALKQGVYNNVINRDALPG